MLLKEQACGKFFSLHCIVTIQCQGLGSEMHFTGRRKSALSSGIFKDSVDNLVYYMV